MVKFMYIFFEILINTMDVTSIIIVRGPGTPTALTNILFHFNYVCHKKIMLTMKIINTHKQSLLW